MANLVKRDGNFIYVLLDGATALPFSDIAVGPDELRAGIKIRSVESIPVANGDLLIVRNAATADQASAPIASFEHSSIDNRSKEFQDVGQFAKPSVHGGDMTTNLQVLLIELAR